MHRTWIPNYLFHLNAFGQRDKFILFARVFDMTTIIDPEHPHDRAAMLALHLMLKPTKGSVDGPGSRKASDLEVLVLFRSNTTAPGASTRTATNIIPVSPPTATAKYTPRP
jgi:hypothetical protein